ncbi:hypothetical protein HELRODRAFT_66271 [Helobdella robusta]|uniref:Anaphase-promoting complex subunit 4 WD40 domain-containing protein n=1 Tax=Helobdella robusta TaxID=6412 RepID=T1FYI9_HELRO|nr:hypothetical protein HELRODRAFT_66271 [Helobdella robusta]ESO02629.1 hypothetical protein HELRODRAFT_66271 [Helobdella robusta]
MSVNNCSQPEITSSSQQIIPQPQIKYIGNNIIKTNLKKKRNNHVPKKLHLHSQNHEKPVNRIKWCCDEFSNLILSASLDSTVKISDIFQKRCVYTIKSHVAGVRDAAWTSCGRKVGSCGYDKMLILTDLEAGKDVYSYLHSEFLTSIQFQPGNDNVMVLGSNNSLLSFDRRLPVKPVKIFKYKDLLDQVLDICFLNEEEFVSSCSFVCRESADRCLMVWDLSTASVISNQIFHEKYTCPRICKHPCRNEFVAQTNGNYVAQFQSEPPYRMNKHKQFNGHKVLGYNVGCDINPNGGTLISGSTDGRVVFYNYASTKLLTSLTTAATTENDDDNIVLDVAWHPVLNGICASSTWNGGLYVWN